MKKNVWKCLLVSLLVGMGLPSISTATDPQSSSIYGKLPLFFVENKGQADTSLQFYSYGGQMYFSQEGIYTHLIQRDSTFQNRFRDKFHEKDSLSLDTAPIQEKHLVLKKRFLNTHTQCEIVGEDELPGKLNYFIGNDSTQWHTNLRTFKQIRYKNLYPGIDLVYHGNQGPTEYDLVINPEAHNLASAPLSQIQFTIEGADKVELSPDGDLLVHTPLGILKEKSPVSYQMKNGIKQSLSSHFTLISDNTFSFEVPQYDKSLSLVIDPLIYSTFLGGSDKNYAWAISIDNVGCAYVTGKTWSSDFPVTPGVYDTTFNGNVDVFVTKLDSEGTGLIYSTYMGGENYDSSIGIVIDTSANVYITGCTLSSCFPTTPDAYDTTFNGGDRDAFISILNSEGTKLVYSTYLGGSDYDEGDGIAIDTADNVYITGYTLSSCFPTTPDAYDTTYNGVYDAFVTKINPKKAALVYSTYLGGENDDLGTGIAIDTYGNTFITGHTSSSHFPTTPFAFDTSINGFQDAFVTKLNSEGTGLIYSTYLGGENGDLSFGITIDKSGNAYITGFTSSSFFPISSNAYDSIINRFDDVFVTKLNSEGNGLVYSTYLGGERSDHALDIAIDESGNAYITGYTESSNFPITLNAFDTSINGFLDVFVTKLNSEGTGLIYSTYLGGSDDDYCYDIAVDIMGNTYITGYTTSSTSLFPTSPYAYNSVFNGNWDVFVSKINLGSISGYPEKGLLPLEVFFIDQTGLPGTITWQWDFGDGGSSTTHNPHNIYTTVGNYTITLITEGNYGISTVSHPNYIHVGYLDGSISCSSTIGLPPFTTQFYGTASSVPAITSWNWNFGDGGISDEQNPSHTYTQYGSYSVQLITSNPYGNDTEIKADYIQLVHVENLLPNIDNLPDLKLLTNTGYQDLFRIEDYNKNKKGDNHGILVNFLGLSSMSADTISQSAYGQATIGCNTYLVSNLYGTVTIGNQVKYSTYRLNKLPWVGLKSGEKTQLNLSSYCYSTAGVVIPPSFGSVSALVVNDTTLLKAKWIDSNSIEITALSGFTTSGWIDVIASPVTSHFGMDLDRERIYVYPNLLSIGEFTCYEDMENYGTEKTTDKTSYPVVSFLTAAQDGSGVSQSNVMSFDFTSADQGIKMTPQFSRMLDYEDNHWYIARMKVSSPTEDNDLQSQLYHYNGVIPDASHIDLSANIYFGTPTTWSWIETPLYTNATGTGYPQIMLKAGTKTGKIYLAEVQVIKAVPTLFDSTPRSKHTLGYAYSDFSSLSQLSMGWSTTECFDNGTSKPALSVMVPGFLTVSFSGGESIKFTAWNGNTQEIYTPSSTPGSEIGMKADIFIQSGSFDTYDAMILLGCYGIAAHGSYDFSSIGGQLAAMAEFGQITEGTHYLAAPGRNGYHQMQFVLKNNENGVLAVQNVDFLRDTDNPYFGDINLFP